MYLFGVLELNALAGVCLPTPKKKRQQNQQMEPDQQIGTIRSLSFRDSLVAAGNVKKYKQKGQLK